MRESFREGLHVLPQDVQFMRKSCILCIAIHFQDLTLNSSPMGMWVVMSLERAHGCEFTEESQPRPADIAELTPEFSINILWVKFKLLTQGWCFCFYLPPHTERWVWLTLCSVHLGILVAGMRCLSWSSWFLVNFNISRLRNRPWADSAWRKQDGFSSSLIGMYIWHHSVILVRWWY